MRVRMTGSTDDATLRRALDHAIGAEKVRTDDSIRRTYSTDASPCAVEPRAVAFAETEDDVRAVLRVCRELEVPITPRASGTSLSGAAIGPGVVLDTTRFHRILEFDRERRRLRVEPGILLAELNAYLAERGMRFAPDPGSQDLCRIGGMVGHNASGPRGVARSRRLSPRVAVRRKRGHPGHRDGSHPARPPAPRSSGHAAPLPRPIRRSRPGRRRYPDVGSERDRGRRRGLPRPVGPGGPRHSADGEGDAAR